MNLWRATYEIIVCAGLKPPILIIRAEKKDAQVVSGKEEIRGRIACLGKGATGPAVRKPVVWGCTVVPGAIYGDVV